ncbi:hypothetical protein KKG61_02405, partial [bacterium]|nr:hypothetical protein [bacterium]MBU2461535.1 hypothetical protein [bacterium]
LGSGTSAFTIYLPTAIGIAGRIYIIKNIGVGIIIDADSGTIDGELKTVTLYNWQSLTIISNGANWFIIDF